MSTITDLVATLPEHLRQTYGFIYTHIELYGYSPTIRDLIKALCLKSPCPVQHRLDKLKAKGLIDWVKGESRTITLTGYRVRLEPIPEFEESLQSGWKNSVKSVLY